MHAQTEVQPPGMDLLQPLGQTTNSREPVTSGPEPPNTCHDADDHRHSRPTLQHVQQHAIDFEGMLQSIADVTSEPHGLASGAVIGLTNHDA